MKEKENKKLSEEQTHERAFWIIGIALIIFLILLGGSIVGMKLIRDKANHVGDVVEGMDNTADKGYVVLENGVKQLTNPAITEFETEVGGRKFYNFSFEVSGDSTDVTAKVTNATEEELPQESYVFKLLDESGNKITSYVIVMVPAEPGATTSILSNIPTDCSSVEKIEISLKE